MKLKSPLVFSDLTTQDTAARPKSVTVLSTGTGLTYTVPADTIAILVECIGGGGGGGGSAGASSSAGFAGGGGSGGYSRKLIVNPAASYVYTVGGGGAGGVAGSNAGTGGT